MRPSPRLVLLLVIVLQGGLLTIGITQDYRLKHEDNNALHATFARAHLRLGLSTTKGQNYFYSPATESGTFYANHPPGPALVLAAVYGLTGRDGPLVTRATAVSFHLVSTLLFLGLARRVFDNERQAALAGVVFVLLPESSFFGRMMNHEVLVLAAALLLVRAYCEVVSDSRHRGRWLVVLQIASVLAVFSGWAGLFVVGACALHAAWEGGVRHNRAAWSGLVSLLVTGAAASAAVLVQLAWVGGGFAHLGALLASRTSAGDQYGMLEWVGRILELHWRYFSLTGILVLGILARRAAGSLRQPAVRESWAEVGLIFLTAGLGYVVVFNLNAARHDYWQFLLLPASGFGIAYCLHALATVSPVSWSRATRLAVLVLACVEITVTAGFTLAQRHLKTEAYCLETVETLRRDAL